MFPLEHTLPLIVIDFKNPEETLDRIKKLILFS
jgi:hypothetical protein